MKYPVAQTLVSLVRAVRQTRRISLIGGLLTMGAICGLLVLKFEPFSRLAMLVPAILYFSRKVFGWVQGRQAEQQLAFEQQFLALGSEPEQLAGSFDRESKIWRHSAIVQGLRATRFMPQLDSLPRENLRNRLLTQFRKSFTALLPPEQKIDVALLIVWMATWMYHSSVQPAHSQEPLTFLALSGVFLFAIIILTEWYARKVYRRVTSGISRFEIEMADWMSEHLASIQDLEPLRSRYTRKEFFRDKPWFTARKRAESK